MAFKARRHMLLTLAITIVGTLALGTPARATDVAPTHPEVRPLGARSTSSGPPGARGRVVVGLRSASAAADVARAMDQQGLAFKGQPRRSGARIVDVEPGREVETARRLAQLPGVAYAEPDAVVTASGPRAPTDSLYGALQWDLPKINMPDAWGWTAGDSAVRVAVIDTGITFNHPDLATQWMLAPGASLNDHVVLSTPLSSGCSIPSAPSDDDGHGTHVAGTIGAASTLSGAPPVGVAGIAPGVRMIPIKALDCQGNGYLSDVAEAIDFAVQAGASVISMSLGGKLSTGCPTYLQTPINRALEAGVFLTAAVGNDGDTSIEFPAGCNGVVGVAATTSTDTHPTFSNSNSSVAISAPGVQITSTWNDGGYAVGDGTSFATPHVSGCAALLKSVNPSLTGPAIRSILQSTAVDLGTAGYDTSFGWGRLDCGAAVTGAAGGRATPTTMPAGAGASAGRGFAISSQGGSVGLSWLSGVGQTGFGVARLANGIVSILLPGNLSPNATSYVDATAPPGLDCYALFVQGTTPQGQSDLECAVVGFGSVTGAPQNFTLRLNQSTTATLSWSPPAGGGQDGYVLVTIGGSLQNLPASATTASVPTNGLTCFGVGALRNGALVGYSDLLCGLPGFSNLGSTTQ